jgi:hypothetical protein
MQRQLDALHRSWAVEREALTSLQAQELQTLYDMRSKLGEQCLKEDMAAYPVGEPVAMLSAVQLHALMTHYTIDTTINPDPACIHMCQALIDAPIAILQDLLGIAAWGDCVHMRCVLHQLACGKGLPHLKTSSKPGKCIERWSVEQVCTWLSRMHGGLQLRHVFTEHKITGQALLALTTTDMATFMNIPRRQCTRIALGIQKLRTKLGLPQLELRRQMLAAVDDELAE